ncbi:MAG: hypothetical protein A2Z14_19770 [Chloroflexi bacterium RBG_16_48_8]|nr:MAG: hypothetical protein A2Z14_19770 [Chloroflexi bacterium RBG_16_48_8]
MTELSSIARWLILFGLFIVVVGILLWIAARFDLPIGKLPGDFRFETKGFTCVFPLATSILISLLLTLLLNLILRWIHK